MDMNPEAGRRCSKQRCYGSAIVTFRFDYQASQVWLEHLPPDPTEAGYVLCASHSDTFVVPLGWTVEDVRTASMSSQSGEPRTAAASPAVEADHPSLRVERVRGLEIRPARRYTAPLEDHPSGPLDLENRSESPEITREINRLARHLALDADTDPGAGVPPDPPGGDVGEGSQARSEASGRLPLEPFERLEPLEPEKPAAAAGRGRAPLFEYEEFDDDSTFGDEVPLEECTEQISLAELARAARIHLDEDKWLEGEYLDSDYLDVEYLDGEESYQGPPSAGRRV